MKIAKQFRWEGAHRLPWHEGLCRNLHGHSYRMFVELEGDVDPRGMLLDFKHLKRALQPLIDTWDHALLVAEDDAVLRRVARETGWKHVVLPFDTTAENLSLYVADHLCDTAADLLHAHHVHTVRVRLHETETCYAEAERPVAPEARTNGEAQARKTASSSE
ncbi:MAG: 6-pyruvoyl tetrahydropterin synthase family protein [Rhodothermales bacterium]